MTSRFWDPASRTYIQDIVIEQQLDLFIDNQQVWENDVFIDPKTKNHYIFTQEKKTIYAHLWGGSEYWHRVTATTDLTDKLKYFANIHEIPFPQWGKFRTGVDGITGISLHALDYFTKWVNTGGDLRFIDKMSPQEQSAVNQLFLMGYIQKVEKGGFLIGS